MYNLQIFWPGRGNQPQGPVYREVLRKEESERKTLSSAMAGKESSHWLLYAQETPDCAGSINQRQVQILRENEGM